MAKNKIRWIFLSLTMSITVRTFLPHTVAGSSPGEINVSYRGLDAALAARFDGFLPQGLKMVDEAIDVLARGKSEMSSTEWALFKRYFDPAATGEIDETFVSQVLENFQEMRHKYKIGLVVEYEAEHARCSGMRLYHTDCFKVYVCPYIHQEDDENRLARDFVHELAHIAMVSMDRAYYSETSTRFAALTPHGHWTSQIPLVGRIFAEIAKQDTLHNPDSYSVFAYELSVIKAGTIALEDEVADPENVILDPEAIASAAAADRKMLALSGLNGNP